MKVFHKLRTFIEGSITPYNTTERDGIQYWQDRILFSMLFIGVFLGFFVYIPSMALSIIEELWLVALADTVVYGWAIFIFFKRSLPFAFRVYSVIVLNYILALVLLLTIGPFGAGPVWLFLSPIITGIFLNLRSTIISLLINTAIITVLGLSISHDLFTWRRAAGFPLQSWLIIGINFLFLNTLSAVAIVSVLRGLQSSLLLEKEALASVELKNQELGESNVNLQRVIDDRNQVQAALLKSEKALEESEILFRDLVNLLPLSYFLMDTNFNLKYVNFKFYEMFQLPNQNNQKHIPENAFELLVPLDRPKAEASIQKLITQQETGWEHYTALTGEEREFPVEILASVVSINQETVGVQGIILDITDRLENEKIKKAKEVAEKTNKAISEWVSFIVHELRTPISGLLQFAQLGLKKMSNTEFQDFLSDPELGNRLSDQTPDADALYTIDQYKHIRDQFEIREKKLSKYFDRIHFSGHRLNRLLNELLDLSRLEAGKMEFIMKKSNLLEVVQEACDEMEASLLSNDLSLKIEGDNVSTEIHCDPFRMGQVIRNLLNNAIKFSTPGTRITVSFKEAELDLSGINAAALQMTVSDQGVGIPPDQIELIFNKFRQSRKTRIGEGSGLGLPICKQIVAAHQGKIWAESQDGKGTYFHIIIPYEAGSQMQFLATS